MTRPFRFAVQAYTAPTPAAWREQARRAEQMGFSAFHLADHVIGPGPALTAMNHPVQDVAAVPAMAVALEATETIRIGCRVFCVDFRRPVVFAKEVATLDFFAEGRLEVGLGAGWMAAEYDAMGIPFDPPGTRLDRLEEVVQLLRAHYGDGPVDIDGEHVHASGFEGVPTPATGLPPLMIGGGSRRVLGIAGREADIVSLNFDNSSGRLGAEGFGTSTADRTEQKLDWIRAGAGARFDDLELEIGAYVTIVTDDRAATLDAMGPVLGLTPEQLGDHPHGLIGSVDHICEQLLARRERYGISYVTFPIDVIGAVAPVVERLAGS
jgi:probable F420-dependent oxidoreductase